MREDVRVPDFAIGSDVWPGLAKLAEECGELVQVIGKLVATGGVTAHWDGTDLQVRLTEEMGDVQGALEFVRRFNPVLDQQALSARAVKKFETFKRWHQDSR